MNIKVRFFAALADIVKSRELTLAMDKDSLTVKEVYGHLCERYADLAKYAQNIRYAVNEEFASPDSRLKEGDEIALLPPVSGGSGKRRARGDRRGASGPVNLTSPFAHRSSPFTLPQATGLNIRSVTPRRMRPEL